MVVLRRQPGVLLARVLRHPFLRHPFLRHPCAQVLACTFLVLALLGDAAPRAWGEDEPDPAVAPTVAVIQGTRVNLRVGPRPGGRPVAELDDGTVLLVVERLPGWVCVQVPAGFLAVVSAKHVEPVGTDGVRVTASRLNMRVQPPEEGKPMPGAFRDRVLRGTVLPLVEREGGWVWVMAPEATRVYVSERYVKQLGPLSKHATIVTAARGRRRTQLEALAQARREKAARRSGATLRLAIGTAQQALYKLRIQRGIARTPVVEVINALEAAIEACRVSPVGTRKLAHAVRQDLEAELELRMARKDAEVASLRGLQPPAERPLEPILAKVEIHGTLRWEAAPTWRNGGEWVLWVGDEPRYVLQLTTGQPRPLPDFKAHSGRGVRVVSGRQSGARVFGLPVLEVRAIRVPPSGS